MEELPLQISAHKAPADGELDGKWRMGSGSGSSWLLGVFTRRLTDFPHARERVCLLVVGGWGKNIYWQCCCATPLAKVLHNGTRSDNVKCALVASCLSTWLKWFPQSLANSSSSGHRHSIDSRL